MSRTLPLLSLSAVLGALAAPVVAAPVETPLKNQAAVLSYEVELTGQRGGKPVHDRLVVRTPVFARESGALNPLGDGFTDSQNAEMADMSAATQGDGDGTSAMLEANRLVEAMMAACSADEGSSACVTARGRFQAHDRAMTEHGAKVAAAQAQVRRRDEDDHRFLLFTAGDGPNSPPPTVEASYDHGGRRGVFRLPDPNLKWDTFSVGDMVVLDRRDGSLFLAVQGGILNDGVRYVDVEPLAGVPGVKRLGLPFSSQVTLAGPQATAGPDGDYAGSKTIETKGLRYQFRWKLERD